MSVLIRLPPGAVYDDFVRARNQSLDTWEETLGLIEARHGLRAEGAERYAAGENPVFGRGGHVIKLVPLFAASVANREEAALRHLDGGGLPVPALLGSGEAEGWRYIICRQVSGRPLQDLLEGLPVSATQAAAGEVGRGLARLHAWPAGDCRPGGIGWMPFVEQQIAIWRERPDVEDLPPPLRDTGEAFLRSCPFDEDPLPHVLLHGDLAPENIIALRVGDEVRLEAMIDFGNAMVGPPLFDLTAPTVIFGRGDREVVHAILRGYGLFELTPRVRQLLMGYSLIHQRAHLPSCVALVPEGISATSWDEVASGLWPE